MKKIKIIVEKTATGYSAYADKFPIYTTGNDVDQLTKNMIEALKFFHAEAGVTNSASKIISEDIEIK